MIIEACELCPRRCGAFRGETDGGGICGMGADPVVARAALHFDEEPCISGSRGSGTVFFAGCPLGCVFCQNHEISRGRAGRRITPDQLALVFRDLEARGAHNINLVNPTHFVPPILQALRIYRPRIPVLYNSGGYERVETLRLLEGFIDIYLPDCKYLSAEAAARYSAAPDYPGAILPALQEMCRQSGPPVYDEEGHMQRGTLVRHLVLPGQSAQAQRVLNLVAEHLPSGTPVSLMAQYTPTEQTVVCPEINRTLLPREYRRVRRHMEMLGLPGYVQTLEAVGARYVPAFNGTGLPPEGTD